MDFVPGHQPEENKKVKQRTLHRRGGFVGWRWLLAVVILTSTAAWAEQGVVVVAVSPHFEAAQSGIEKGDRLLGWSRGAERGVITSPFELMRIELEESPLGTVTIEGFHESHSQRWELGQEDWGVKTRPDFGPVALHQYLKGRKLAEDGQASGAFEVWRAIAPTDVRQNWISLWCAADSAEVVVSKKRWSTADQLYRKALAEVGRDPLARVFLLRSWAVTFEQRGEWGIATRVLRQSLAASEAYDTEGLMTASILRDFALVNDWRRDLNQANQLYRHALAIDLKLSPQGLVTARTLISLAKVYINRDDQQSAQTFLEEARPILQRVSPRGPDYARFDGESGSILMRQGDIKQAEQDFEQAKNILEECRPDSIDMAKVLSSLSFISARQGNLSRAELQLRRALAIYENAPIEPVLGFHLANDLGVIAYERNDFETAEKYALKTESILQKLAPNSRDHAGCLNNLGLYALASGRPYAAEGYWRQALAMIEKSSPESMEPAKLLTDLSYAAIQLGDFDKAEQYAVRARAILTKVGPEGVDLADVMFELADIANHRGHFSQAEEYIQHALSIDGKAIPESADYAERIAILATILRAEGQTELAGKEYEKAITILESAMERLGGDSSARSDFRASHNSIYKDYIDLLVQQGKSERAFEVAEQAHASTLLEFLGLANVEIRQDIDPTLRAQEKKLRDEFSLESDRRIRALMKPNSAEELRTSEARLSTLLGKLDEVESQIRAANPAYAQLTQPDSTTIKNVQRDLLDPDTLLLEYSLGEERSYVWLISSESASVYSLPGRAKIEKTVHDAYEELAHPGTYRSSDPAGSEAPINVLSRMILGPIEHQLHRKRLLVVADGAVNYIPFSALRAQGDSDKVLPLVESHEIVNLPSASVLIAMRREHESRPAPVRAIAVLADPVFDAGDPRVRRIGTDGSNAPLATDDEKAFAGLRSVEITRSRWATAFDVDRKKNIVLPRLVYSRHEADEIVSFFPSNDSLEALDFKASRAEALSPTLAQYRIVHFATHGLISTTHPEFSGLVFSLYNEKGNAEIGLMSLEDIYNLSLPVDMVVLSACETALGKDAKGEGLIGLTRGFMYAGASRVVASLWAVNDVATAKLMASFYRAMEEDHLPAAAALRKAQLDVRRNKRWANPYYWAGFELQGRWK